MSQANRMVDDPTRTVGADTPCVSIPVARLVRIVLGLFLLVAAGLKIHGFVLDPLVQDSFLASPRLLLATIEVEILLGLWLVSGWWPRAAWVATLGFFALLAAASLYLVLTPESSTLAQDTAPQKQCFGINCQTQDCYRTGYNKCNTTGNECRQKSNYKLCGACVCRPNEPDPCLCDY